VRGGFQGRNDAVCSARKRNGLDELATERRPVPAAESRCDLPIDQHPIDRRHADVQPTCNHVACGALGC
jgi:hypothetical protein